MKNQLFILSLIFAGLSLTGRAESEVFLFDYAADLEGVADNGQYAVATDPENLYAYLWSASSPDSLIDITLLNEDDDLPSSQFVKGSSAMDVSDDGMVVGSIYYKDGYQKPAYYKDGEWVILPVDAAALYQNEAVAVTPDGSVIAGYQFIGRKDAHTGGKFYPCQWLRQENGEYDLVTYLDLQLPDHQGFFPMTQTPDGKVIAGTLFCGAGSNINAYVKDGEMIIFDTFSTVKEPIEYKGKYEAIDEDGKTIFVEDINDPRVIWVPYEYINGYKDGAHGDDYLYGFFTNSDANGNLYGARSFTENVQEDGSGDLVNRAVMYNYLTDEWVTDEGAPFFSAGLGEDLIFTGNGEVIKGNEILSVQEAYDIETEYIINGINKISKDAKTLGGVMSELNDITNEYSYFPFIVMIDGGTNGVSQLAGNPKTGLVIVTEGQIEVVNADNVAVYDLDGRLMSTSKVSSVDPGVYVVKADKASYKVLVK